MTPQPTRLNRHSWTGALRTASKRFGAGKLFIGLLTLASFYFLYLRRGLIIGHDLLYEMVRLVEFKEAVTTQGFPRLAPELYFGYGSPIFVFYPPLFLWLTSLADFVFHNINDSVKVVIVALGVMGSIFCYSFLRLFSHKKAAVLGAVFYLLAPYKFADIYSRNAFAEYTAFCLLPPVFYFLASSFRAGAKDPIRYQIGFFISFILLSLSHTISLLMVLPFVTLTALCLYWNAKTQSAPGDQKPDPPDGQPALEKKALCGSSALPATCLLSALAIVVLALGAASFYLLPAFFYRDLVRMEELTTGKFYFGRNFVSPSELALDRSSFLYQSPLPFLALVWGLSYAFRSPARFVRSPLGILGLGFSLTALFMLSSPSFFLWNLIPLSPYIQFPWRFLLLFSFFISWVVAFIAAFQPRREAWFYIATPALILLLGVLHYSQHRDFKSFDATTITPEQILFLNLPATVGTEYLPRVAETAVPERSERKKAFESAKKEKNASSPTRYKRCRLFPEKSKFEFALLNFPYWMLSVDGVSQSISKSAATLQLEVPAGEHCVEARLGYLNLQIVGFFASVCSIALFSVCAVWRSHQLIPPNRPAAPDRW